MKQSKTFYDITNSTLLIKKRLRHRCFPVNFAKFLKTPFFTEHVRASVSGKNLTKFFFQSRLESHCSWHNRIIFKYLFIYCCTNVRFVVINSDRCNFISQPSTGPSDLLVQNLTLRDSGVRTFKLQTELSYCKTSASVKKFYNSTNDWIHRHIQNLVKHLRWSFLPK